MSVKIVYKNGKIEDYTKEKCLVDQLSDASLVEINIEDIEKADQFLSDVSNKTRYEILPPVKIKVDHKDTIVGAKIAKKAKQASKATVLMWLAKEIVKNQFNLESRLNDIILTIKEKFNA
jgi:hypothetical protein